LLGWVSMHHVKVLWKRLKLSFRLCSDGKTGSDFDGGYRQRRIRLRWNSGVKTKKTFFHRHSRQGKISQSVLPYNLFQVMSWWYGKESAHKLGCFTHVACGLTHKYYVVKWRTWQGPKLFFILLRGKGVNLIKLVFSTQLLVRSNLSPPSQVFVRMVNS